MGRDEMGDEFRCFLVALFAWYVGPLACKGIVQFKQTRFWMDAMDFEWETTERAENLRSQETQVRNQLRACIAQAKMHQISGIHLRARSRKLSLKNWPRASSHCGRARMAQGFRARMNNFHSVLIEVLNTAQMFSWFSATEKMYFCWAPSIPWNLTTSVVCYRSLHPFPSDITCLVIKSHE